MTGEQRQLIEMTPLERHQFLDGLATVRRECVEVSKAVIDERSEGIQLQAMPDFFSLIAIFEYRLWSLMIYSRAFTENVEVLRRGDILAVREKDSTWYREQRIALFSGNAHVNRILESCRRQKDLVVARLDGSFVVDWPSVPVLVQFDGGIGDLGAPRVQCMDSALHTSLSNDYGVPVSSRNFARHYVFTRLRRLPESHISSVLGHSIGHTSSTWPYSSVGVEAHNEAGRVIEQDLRNRGIVPFKVSKPPPQAAHRLRIATPTRDDSENEKPFRPSVLAHDCPAGPAFDQVIAALTLLEKKPRSMETDDARLGAALFMTIMSAGVTGELLRVVLDEPARVVLASGHLVRRWVRARDGVEQLVVAPLTVGAEVYWAMYVSNRSKADNMGSPRSEPRPCRVGITGEFSRCLKAFYDELGIPIQASVSDLEKASSYTLFERGVEPWIITENSRVHYECGSASSLSSESSNGSSPYLDHCVADAVQAAWADLARRPEGRTGSRANCRPDDVVLARSTIRRFFSELEKVSTRKFRGKVERKAAFMVCRRFLRIATEIWPRSSSVHLAIRWTYRRITNPDWPGYARIRSEVAALVINGLMKESYWNDLRAAELDELTMAFSAVVDRQKTDKERDRYRTRAGQMTRFGAGRFFSEAVSLDGSTGDTPAGSSRATVIPLATFDALIRVLSQAASRVGLILRCAINLMFWLGLRPCELLGLRLCDVRIVGDTVIINVWGNKTVAARRRLPAHVLLPPVALADLLKLLDLRRQELMGCPKALARSAALLGDRGMVEAYRYDVLCGPINTLLTAVFGPRVTQYSLRHAFVNYLMLRAQFILRPALRNTTGLIDHWAFSDEALEQLRPCLRTSEWTPTDTDMQVGALIPVAKAAGHAGFETMFRVYMHIYGLLVTALLRRVEAERFPMGKLSGAVRSAISGFRSRTSLAAVPSDPLGLLEWIWGRK